MKRALNISLVLSSLFGYLEWGNNNAFLFQVEYDLIFNTPREAQTFTHPFILLPLCGQLVLLFTMFQKTPSKALTFIGLICLSMIMIFLFIIGIMSQNLKIAAAALPFIATGVLVLWHHRKKRMRVV